MTWTTNRTSRSKYASAPLEDSKPERIFRRIIEEVDRAMRARGIGLRWHSQVEDDFTVDCWTFGIHGGKKFRGAWHDKQARREHDAYRASENIKLGNRPLFWHEEELRKEPTRIKSVMTELILISRSAKTC